MSKKLLSKSECDWAENCLDSANSQIQQLNTLLDDLASKSKTAKEKLIFEAITYRISEIQAEILLVYRRLRDGE